MLQKIKMIGGVGLVGFALVYGLLKDGQNIAAATERYGLTEAGEALAKTCRSALSSNDQEFSSGRSEISGCACLAAEVAKTYDDDLETTGIILTAMIEMADEPEDQEADWAAMATRANIDELTLGQHISVSMSAMGVCNQAS